MTKSLCFLLIFSSALVFAKSNSVVLVPVITKGTVVSVPDGDTLCIKTENNEFKKVRLQGNDAPENDQPDGEWSGQLLRQLSLNANVTITSGREDQYGRLLGFAELIPNLQDECVQQQLIEKQNEFLQLNEYMLCKGASWYYARYESSFTPENRKRWTDANNKAKQDKTGLWKTTDIAPIPPWEWRQDHKPEPIPCPELSN